MMLSLVLGCAALSEPTRIPVDDDPCELADETAVCQLCLTGEVTCSFDDVSATEVSCQTCAAEHALYEQLCLDGVERITGDVVCETGPIPPELR